MFAATQSNLQASRLAIKRQHVTLQVTKLVSASFGHPFQNEMFSFRRQRSGSHRAHESLESFEFEGSVSGAVLAIVIGMDNRTATSRVGALKSFVRVVRGFAEGSLIVLGFALAILLIGTPLALVARGVHEGLSWLVALYLSDCSSGSSTGGVGFVFAGAVVVPQRRG